MLVVIAFDISDDRQRRRVVKRLQGVGLRVQYSVFECWLRPPQLRKLQRQLARLVESQDRISYYPLCPKDQRRRTVRGSAVVLSWDNAVYVD